MLYIGFAYRSLHDSVSCPTSGTAVMPTSPSLREILWYRLGHSTASEEKQRQLQLARGGPSRLQAKPSCAAKAHMASRDGEDLRVCDLQKHEGTYLPEVPKERIRDAPLFSGEFQPPRIRNT